MRAFLYCAGGGCIGFQTGYGGYLQALQLSYLGVWYDAERLSFTPSLPPASSALNVRALDWRGGEFDVNIESERVTVVLSSYTSTTSTPQTRFALVERNSAKRVTLDLLTPRTLPLLPFYITTL